MNLSRQRQKEKDARDLIYKALQEYDESGSCIPRFQDKKITVDKYSKDLTPKGIDAGVSALVLINNMSGGTVGDVNLYRLLQRYLFNKDDRDKINSIINKT